VRCEGRNLYAGAEQSRDTGWYQDMLVAYATANGVFNKVSVNQHSDLTPEMVWLDMVSPTEQDRQWVRQTYGQELRFVEELGEIEASEEPVLNSVCKGHNMIAEGAKDDRCTEASQAQVEGSVLR
jgi:hypothetical protein